MYAERSRRRRGQMEPAAWRESLTRPGWHPDGRVVSAMVLEGLNPSMNLIEEKLISPKSRSQRLHR
jgi:hypothetical protein